MQINHSWKASLYPQHSDLAVDLISSSLAGVKIDVCVSGSVAAIESFHLVRALRRLGAAVRVVLSPAGEMFVSSQAFEWASAQKVVKKFSGVVSHLASGHMCVVAPASASFLSRLASGIADSPAAALCQSYLGAGLPVMVVPCMNDSLWNSPFVAASVEQLSQKVLVLSSRKEEGKHKFPDPVELSFEISHHYHKHGSSTACEALVVMGATRGYLDDVRYMTSFSSGKMGSLISEELYRYGVEVAVVSGDSTITPRCYSSFHFTPTFSQMLERCTSLLKEKTRHLIMPASILDYEPAHRESGKVASGKSLKVTLKNTLKLRSLLASANKESKTICFKLEAKKPKDLQSHPCLPKLALDGVDMVVVNYLQDIHQDSYTGYVHHIARGSAATELSSKAAVAEYIRSYLLS